MNDFTFQQIYVLLLLGFALVLFVTSWMRFDLVAIAVLTLLVVPSLFEGWEVIDPGDALAGFSEQAILVLACLFVIARALQRTGFSDSVAAQLQRLTGRSENRLFGVLLALVGSLSAFVNNTAMTAMSIPVVLRCCNRLGINPSRIYLPLAYVSLVGGGLTLIGTTTNIAVSSVLEGQRDLATPPLGMFEMMPAGLIFLVIAGVCLYFVSPFLLGRKGGESLFGKYNVKEFLSEILVKADSGVVGRPLQELHFGHDYDITIMGLVRDGKTHFSPPPTMVVRDGDVLMVQGGVENIISLRKEKRMQLVNELRVEQGTMRSLDLFMAEVVLLPNSSFLGMTVRDIDLRDHYGVTILAFSRRGLQRVENMADIPLEVGDTLLIQGHLSGIDRLRRHPNLLVLETLDRPLTHGRLPVALTILGLLILMCSIQSEVLFLNFLLAVLLLIATRCIRLADVYQSIDWRILVLIGALFPLGQAVEQCGVIDHVRPLLPDSPLLLLAAIYLVTFFLTQVVSNVVSAVVMTPIALALSAAMDVDHRPLIMGVAFSASFSFITPYGHQACTLVMGPGNYRSADYLKLGAVLGVLLFLMALWVIPLFFPFHPS